MTTKGQGDD